MRLTSCIFLLSNITFLLAQEKVNTHSPNQLTESNIPIKAVQEYLHFSDSLITLNKNTQALDSLYNALQHINHIPINLANKLLSTIGKAHYALQNDTLSFKKVYFNLNDRKAVVRNCNLLLTLIDFYTKNQNSKKAAESVQRATVLATKVNNINLQMKILQKKGIVEFQLNHYERALESFNQTQKYFKKHNVKMLEAEALRYMAKIHFNKANYSKSTKLFKQSLKIDSGNHTQVLKILAKLNQIDEKHNKAIQQLNEAIKLIQQQNNSETSELYYLSAGSHFMLKEIEESKQLFDSAIHYAKKDRNFYLLGKALSAKSKCYLEQGDYKMAVFYLKNAYVAADESFEQRIENLYAKENAYYNNIYHSAQINGLRKDQQIKELELAHSKNKNILLLVVLAAISVGLILIVWLFILNKRFNNQLQIKNKIIDNNNKELQAINNALSNSQINLLNSNKIKDRMFSIITHDIKGALTSIRAQLERLNSEQDKPYESTDIIESGKNLINNTIHLINHHITWAVRQTNHIKVDKTNISLNKIISKNISLYNAIIETKKIKINTNLNASLKIDTDIKMLNLIFRNLLSNAVKHSPLNNSITITATKNQQYTLIMIEDNGPGIPHDQISGLFNLNQEQDEISHPNQGGSGLYLSYRFAKSMGGKLWVENKKNKGCIFHLEIPN